VKQNKYKFLLRRSLERAKERDHKAQIFEAKASQFIFISTSKAATETSPGTESSGFGSEYSRKLISVELPPKCEKAPSSNAEDFSIFDAPVGCLATLRISLARLCAPPSRHFANYC
jgi:hypothetical protein